MPLIVAACDGRYLLGSAAVADAGDGGQEGGAHTGAAGSTGTAGSAGGTNVDGGAAGASEVESVGGVAEAGAASAADEPAIERTRWLMIETYEASYSSLGHLQLFDLWEPTWRGVTVEPNSAALVWPSPDDHWVLYAAIRESDTLDHIYDYYVVNTAGDAPGARQLVVSDQATPWRCVWSPDGGHVACAENSFSPASDEGELVLFDTSGSSLGAAVDVGPMRGTPSFISPTSLAYISSERELLRLDFGVAAVPATTPIGVPTSAFVSTPDGQQLFCTAIDSSQTLVDFRLSRKQLLDVPAFFAMGPDFQFGIDTSEYVDNDHMVNAYYAVSNLIASPAGKVTVSHDSRGRFFGTAMAGRSVIHSDGDGLTFVYVPENGQIVVRSVPIDDGAADQFTLDPTGHFLYFTSIELGGGKPIVSTTKHWLSRLHAGGAEPPQLLAEGFENATYAFSSDGKLFYFAGNPDTSDELPPTAIHLFTLSLTEPPRDRVLPQTLRNAPGYFSKDNTYLAFTGDSLSAATSEVYVLDLLDRSASPQLLVSSAKDPTTSTGSAFVAAF